jgi:hypothetical protein
MAASAFESFVQQELPKRGYLNNDVSQETIIVRRGPGPRQFDAIELQEGEILALVNGKLQGVAVSDPSIGGNSGLRSAVFRSTTNVSVWTIQHNLDSENVIVQAFDDDKFVIIPNTIQIVDENTVKLTFSSAQNGTARIVFLD